MWKQTWKERTSMVETGRRVAIFANEDNEACYVPVSMFNLPFVKKCRSLFSDNAPFTFTSFFFPFIKVTHNVSGIERVNIPFSKLAIEVGVDKSIQ